MNLNDYLIFAKSTAVYPKIYVLKNPTIDQIRRCAAVQVELIDLTWVYPLIGLVGEAGELANILKKTIRNHNFETEPKINEIIDEKGDLNWYMAMLDYELKIEPEQVLKNNVKKLLERKQQGTIHDNEAREIQKKYVPLFMDVIKNLEGNERIPVLKDRLISELIRTKYFGLDRAKFYIKKLQREGVIYESRPGAFNTV